MSIQNIERSKSSWRAEHHVVTDVAQRMGSTALLTCFSFDTAVDSIISRYKDDRLSLDEAKHYIDNEAQALAEYSQAIPTLAVRARMQNQVDFAQKRLLIGASLRTPGIYEHVKQELFDGAAGLAASGLAQFLSAEPRPSTRALWIGSLNEQTALTLLNVTSDTTSEPHIAMPASTRSDILKGCDIDLYYHDERGLRHAPVSIKSGRIAADEDRAHNHRTPTRRHITTISGHDMHNNAPSFTTAHRLNDLYSGYPGIDHDSESKVINLSFRLIESIKANNT